MSAQPIEIRMAHLEGAYEQINERLRGVDGRLTALDQKIDSRFDALDQKVDARFDAFEKKMDARFDKQDARFDKQDARFDKQDSRFDALSRKIDTSQWQMVSLVVGTWVTLMLAIFLHKP